MYIIASSTLFDILTWNQSLFRQRQEDNSSKSGSCKQSLGFLQWIQTSIEVLMQQTFIQYVVMPCALSHKARSQQQIHNKVGIHSFIQISF